MKIKLTADMRMRLAYAEELDITDIIAPIIAECNELAAQLAEARHEAATWEKRCVTETGALLEMTEQRDAFAIRLEDAENQYSELHNLNSKLAAQSVELAATVEALRKAIMSNCYDDPSTSGQRLMDLANRTPQQHLRDVRAEAGRAGCIYGINALMKAQVFGGGFNADVTSDQYAASVKAGE